MKSYANWILCFTIAFCASNITYATDVIWFDLIGGVFWIIGLWGYYFTEKTNIARFNLLEKAYRREQKRAAADRKEATGEIEDLQEMLKEEKAKKNIKPGSRINMDKLREIKEKAARATTSDGK